MSSASSKKAHDPAPSKEKWLGRPEQGQQTPRLPRNLKVGTSKNLAHIKCQDHGASKETTRGAD